MTTTGALERMSRAQLDGAHCGMCARSSHAGAGGEAWRPSGTASRQRTSWQAVGCAERTHSGPASRLRSQCGMPVSRESVVVVREKK